MQVLQILIDAKTCQAVVDVPGLGQVIVHNFIDKAGIAGLAQAAAAAVRDRLQTADLAPPVKDEPVDKAKSVRKSKPKTPDGSVVFDKTGRPRLGVVKGGKADPACPA